MPFGGITGLPLMLTGLPTAIASAAFDVALRFICGAAKEAGGFHDLHIRGIEIETEHVRRRIGEAGDFAGSGEVSLALAGFL